MPYASARSCEDRVHTTQFGSIDLTGTKFAVASSQSWHLQGYSNNGGPFGKAGPAAGVQIGLYVGGFPAGISPCDDYYTKTGGACLQLVYVP